MGEGSEGLSLQGLAERMEAQTRRLEALERENAELRGEVTALKGAATRTEGPEYGIEAHDEVVEERVSRRAMLTKAGAVAVAAVAAGTLLSPREAKAATVQGTGVPGVWGIATDDGSSGVMGTVQTGAVGDGVSGRGNGNGHTGVYGENTATDACGVYGQGDTGVHGQSTGADKPGVRGDGDNIGVYGASYTSDGYGVEGEGATGVHGHTQQYGYSGVYGLHEGTTGYGLYGKGTGTGAGVLGRNPSGAGVEANQSRYGGKFDGSTAPLLLVTKGTKGRPTSGAHAKGALYLDSAASIFVCTKGGTPGTWRKVTTTSA